MVTDYNRFGYLMDVYILEEHRGKGLGKEMIKVLMNIDWVRNLSSILLATQSAQGFYENFGFKLVEKLDRMMKRC